MSKCSVTKCPKYTGDGKMLELDNGVVAWVPLCAKHKAEWVSGEHNTKAEASPKLTKRKEI